MDVIGGLTPIAGCRLAHDEIGVWRGHWLRYGTPVVELTPSGPPNPGR